MKRNQGTMIITLATITACVTMPLFAESQGEQLFRIHCGTCHTISPPPNKAPPVFGISRHYAMKYRNKEQFVAAIVAYTKAPDPAKSLMPYARSEFGAMAPIVEVPDASLQKIAEFMYSYATPGGRRGGRGPGFGRGAPK